MKIKLLIYKLTDSWGGISWDCCQEPSDSIVIGGYDENYDYQQFDCEAYYIYTWADTYGFKVENIEKEAII